MPLNAANRAALTQSVKTAIAGVASLYAAKLCRLPEDYWASITALIVMQSNVGATLSASWTRLAGTAVGAIVGAVFMVMWGANTMAFACAVAIAFYLCSVLKLGESQRLSTVTVAILMLIGRNSSAWAIALHRFLEVSIGILVAMLISFVLLPSRARESLRKELAEALTDMQALYLAVAGAYRSGAVPEIEALRIRLSASLVRVHDLLRYSAFERVSAAEHHEMLTLVADHVDRIFEAVVALEVACRGSAGNAYVRNFEVELGQLESRIAMCFEWLAASIQRWQFGGAWPDPEPGVRLLDERASASRIAGLSRTYDLEELLRFYSFLLSSKNLAKELEIVYCLVTSKEHSMDRPV